MKSQKYRKYTIQLNVSQIVITQGLQHDYEVSI